MKLLQCHLAFVCQEMQMARTAHAASDLSKVVVFEMASLRLLWPCRIFLT